MPKRKRPHPTAPSPEQRTTNRTTKHNPPTPTRLEVLQATLAGQPIPMTTAQRAALPVMITKAKALMIKAALGAAYVDYQETDNPIHLLNGFVTAQRAKIPMPDWILHPMAAAIERVLAGRGTLTLDQALGFTVSQGKRTRWTEQAQHEYDARLKYLIDVQLKQGLPLISDQAGADSAVDAVAQILRRDPDEHTRIPNNLPAPTVAGVNDDTLRQAYTRRLKKHSSRLSK